MDFDTLKLYSFIRKLLSISQLSYTIFMTCFYLLIIFIFLYFALFISYEIIIVFYLIKSIEIKNLKIINNLLNYEMNNSYLYLYKINSYDLKWNIMNSIYV